MRRCHGSNTNRKWTIGFATAVCRETCGFFLPGRGLDASEIKAISPLVDRLMRLIEGLNAFAVRNPALNSHLRKALNNAVVHGNRMDRQKLVQILCRCELGRGFASSSKTKDKDLIRMALPDPTVGETIGADHGRGIW